MVNQRRPSTHAKYVGCGPANTRSAFPEERIGAEVRVDPSGCWFYKDPDSYSMISVHGYQVYVHRWIYEFFNGPIPEGMHIHHTCERKGCVRKRHLVAMTVQEHRREHQRLDRLRRLRQHGLIQ